ncbi:MAG TPA: trypsin-like serine protease, partial [Minicystis sp.]|nr:trypsin-like serine protease [Minicystis sp.]
MRLGIFVLTFALAAPMFAAGCAAPPGDPEPVANGSEPIVNGTSASAYPEAVLVDLYQGGQLYGYCSGSLIAPQVVLTAGHCVYQFNSWHIKAPYVSQTATASSGATYDWTATGESVDPNMHDIGLIFLNTPITLNAYPDIPSSPVSSGSQVVNIGRIRNGQVSMSGLYVSTPITVHSGSQYGYPYDYEAQDVIESGDSGGPDEIPGTHTIVSVNSGGGQDEVLARTDLLYDWIEQQIQAHGGSGSSGSGSGVTTGTSTGSGMGGSSGGDCTTCADDAQNGGACSAQTQACGNNPDCANLVNCLNGCSDQNCVNQCASQYQNGINDYNNLINCVCDTACPTQCAAECGGSSSSST